VTRTVEPGGTEIGREIRRILLDSKNSGLDARAELLLYFASRAQNVAEVIRPALAQGRAVVCDRFTDSTLVYQGAGRGLGARPSSRCMKSRAERCSRMLRCTSISISKPDSNGRLHAIARPAVRTNRAWITRRSNFTSV
jgi:hypothetical protein